MSNKNTHIILCILDDINKEKFLLSNKKTSLKVFNLNDEPFEHNNLKVYDVMKAEEPVKYLLYEAKNKQETVEKVIYFCPEECRENFIPDNFSALNCDTKISAEEYFQKRIIDYCKKYHIHIPEFEAHDYLSNIPSNSILEFCNVFLSNEGIIDIDITGGRDDASALIQMISQITNFNAHARIGCVVYCDHEHSEIIHQNSSFDMSSTFIAIQDFLNYGRAEKLNKYFNNINKSEKLAKETQELSESLADFSNSLSVCDIEDIENKINRVCECIENARIRFNKVQEERENFRKVQKEYEVKKELDGFKDIKDAISFFTIRDVQGLGFCNNFEIFESELDKMHKSYNFDRNDILFFSLLGVFEKQFSEYFKNSDNLILAMAKWCADRDYVVQALILLKERFADIMIDKGYIKPTEYFLENDKYWIKKHNDYVESLQERDILVDSKENCQKTIKNSLWKAISKFDGENWDINNSDDWTFPYKANRDLCINNEPINNDKHQERIKITDLFTICEDEDKFNEVMNAYEQVSIQRNVICHSIESPNFQKNTKREIVNIINDLLDILNRSIT